MLQRLQLQMLVCLLAVLGFITPTLAQEKKPVKPEVISGQVKKVDEKSITLSIVQKNQPAEEKSFDLAPDAKILVLGKPAKVTEVAVDKPADIQLNAEKKVVAIAQGGAEKPNKGEKGAGGIAGIFKSFDEKANTVKVAVVTEKGQPPTDQTFPLAAEVKVMLGFEAGKLANLKADQPVQLSLNADKKVVSIIQIDKSAAGGISGIVKKVDEKSITLEVVKVKGQPAESETFTLAAEVKVLVAGTRGKISDLKVDRPANVMMGEGKKVIAIAQGNPDKPNKGEKGAGGISGMFKSFDEKANTIKVAVVTDKGQPPSDQTFPLAAEVKVSVLNNPAKLADLKADKPVQLSLNADKKVVAVIQADKNASGGVTGVVKKVDEKSITLDVVKVKGQPAESQTFSLVPEVKISISGARGKISDLQIDKPAQLMVGDDKKVIAIAQGKGEKPMK